MLPKEQGTEHVLDSPAHFGEAEEARARHLMAMVHPEQRDPRGDPAGRSPGSEPGRSGGASEALGVVSGHPYSLSDSSQITQLGSRGGDSACSMGFL